MENVKENFKKILWNKIKSNDYDCREIKFGNELMPNVKLPNGQFCSQYKDSKGNIKYKVADCIKDNFNINFENGSNIYINGSLEYSNEKLNLLIELQELLNNNNELKFGMFEEYYIKNKCMYLKCSFMEDEKINIYNYEPDTILNICYDIKNKLHS